MYDQHQYLHNMQKTYYLDVVSRIFPGQKVTVSDFQTSKERSRDLSLSMRARLKTGKQMYYGILEYRNWRLVDYDTNYGMFVIDLMPLPEDSDETIVQYIINPITADTNCNLPEEERERFYRDLSVWPDMFQSVDWVPLHDGRTIPDLLDVVIAYARAKKKQPHDMDSSSDIHEGAPGIMTVEEQGADVL